jgi:hypothetical protein
VRATPPLSVRQAPPITGSGAVPATDSPAPAPAARAGAPPFSGPAPARRVGRQSCGHRPCDRGPVPRPRGRRQGPDPVMGPRAPRPDLQHVPGAGARGFLPGFATGFPAVPASAASDPAPARPGCAADPVPRCPPRPDSASGLPGKAEPGGHRGSLEGVVRHRPAAVRQRVRARRAPARHGCVRPPTARARVRPSRGCFPLPRSRWPRPARPVARSDWQPARLPRVRCRWPRPSAAPAHGHPSGHCAVPATAGW